MNQITKALKDASESLAAADTLHNLTTAEVYFRNRVSGPVLESVLVSLKEAFEIAMEISDGAGSPVWTQDELDGWIEEARAELNPPATTAASVGAARAILARLEISDPITLPLAAIIDRETNLPALVERHAANLVLASELVAFANKNNRINLTGHLARAVELAREIVKGGGK